MIRSYSIPKYDETLQQLDQAIANYGDYTGPGHWQVRPTYHPSKLFVALEYIVAIKNDQLSSSLLDMLIRTPDLPWQQFGGKQILEAAGVELAPGVDLMNYVSEDWYTEIGYIAVYNEIYNNIGVSNSPLKGVDSLS